MSRTDHHPVGSEAKALRAERVERKTHWLLRNRVACDKRAAIAEQVKPESLPRVGHGLRACAIRDFAPWERELLSMDKRDYVAWSRDVDALNDRDRSWLGASEDVLWVTATGREDPFEVVAELIEAQREEDRYQRGENTWNVDGCGNLSVTGLDCAKRAGHHGLHAHEYVTWRNDGIDHDSRGYDEDGDRETPDAWYDRVTSYQEARETLGTDRPIVRGGTYRPNVTPKLRVHEIAKMVGLTGAQMVTYLRASGEYVKSASSTVPEHVGYRVVTEFPNIAATLTESERMSDSAIARLRSLLTAV